MIYLISSFRCSVFLDSAQEIFPYAKYQIVEPVNRPTLIFGEAGELPICVNFFDVVFNKQTNKNLTMIEYKSDSYIFLFASKFTPPNFTAFKVKNFEITISISSELILNLDGENLLKRHVGNVVYSKYETWGEYILIYFTGERDFLVALKGKTLVFADFYDECDRQEKEIYFLSRLKDSLNHGRVFHLGEGGEEEYLVYLDDLEMKLKDEFVPVVFFDCLRAGNFKYCNQLLADEIRQSDEKNIREFFPDFDDFFPLKERVVALIKNNALAGVVEFEVKDKKIENLIIL